MQPIRHWTLVALLACVAATACARETQASAATANAGTKGEAAVQDTIKGPTLTRDEFKALVFKVVDGIDSREKLTRDNLERIIGLKLSPNPREPDIRTITGNGAEGWWRWNVNIATYAPDDTRLEMLASPNQVDDLGNSPECTYDFQEFNDRLKQQGFRELRESGVHGHLQEWRYSRNGKILRIGYYHSGAPEADAGRCIQTVRLSFAMTDKELGHG